MAKISRIDPFCKEIDNFRKDVILENGGDIKYVDTFYSHKEEGQNEESWKFSKSKWSRLKLDALYACSTEKVHSISGARLYNGWIRFGMMYYRLRDTPTDIQSPLWLPNGFLAQTLNDLSNENTPGYFMSIYPHNEKLAKWVKALTQGRYRQNKYTDGMKNLRVHPEPVTFNQVQQYIIYNKDGNIEDLLNVIKE